MSRAGRCRAGWWGWAGGGQVANGIMVAGAITAGLAAGVVMTARLCCAYGKWHRSESLRRIKVRPPPAGPSESARRGKEPGRRQEACLTPRPCAQLAALSCAAAASGAAGLLSLAVCLIYPHATAALAQERGGSTTPPPPPTTAEW